MSSTKIPKDLFGQISTIIVVVYIWLHISGKDGNYQLKKKRSTLSFFKGKS